jgi:hypothetical protein
MKKYKDVFKGETPVNTTGEIPEKMNKDYYIRKISSLSNRYGDKLIELMELYNCSNLQQVTEEQVKEFYNKI